MNTAHARTTNRGSLRKAAFEIAKGRRAVLFLSEADVVTSIAPGALLDALQEGFKALSAGAVQTPARPAITVPGKGFSLSMSAWRDGHPICVKVVNVFDGNLERGLPNHLAMITLFDQKTESTLCVMDGTHITGLRTAASAALSARLLSRKDSKTATIVGAGVQAREHLAFLAHVREFDEIFVSSLRYEDAKKLARLSPLATPVRSIQKAVAASDIVCLCTHSPKPVIDPRWVRPGTHVSSVGYRPPIGELPRELATENRVFVETRDAFKPPPIGCSELTGLDPVKAVELGEIVSGARKGRIDAGEITVYKAMGIALEDMVAAEIAYKTALRGGRGTRVEW
jgi:ornithine cyclodeaminase/alanine dehydrogenase-like protein (mu-crystallin family)